MCCQPNRVLRASAADLGRSDCCCCDTPLARHFISKKEMRQRLEEYKKELEQELEGVEERMKEIEDK